jgi:hypothetical protein
MPCNVHLEHVDEVLRSAARCFPFPDGSTQTTDPVWQTLPGRIPGESDRHRASQRECYDWQGNLEDVLRFFEGLGERGPSCSLPNGRDAQRI